MKLKVTIIAITSVVFASIFLSPVVQASPYLISDARVRSLDATPTLGRGYSIMTNSFQSTCMNAEELTIPSFNYDCEFLIYVYGLWIFVFGLKDFKLHVTNVGGMKNQLSFFSFFFTHRLLL